MTAHNSLLSRAQQLNLETGRLRWPELERHFARGAVIVVSPESDLVDTAAAFVDDRAAQVEVLLGAGKIRKATIDDATAWQQSGNELWAVVAAPWVLVQSG